MLPAPEGQPLVSKILQALAIIMHMPIYALCMLIYGLPEVSELLTVVCQDAAIRLSCPSSSLEEEMLVNVGHMPPCPRFESHSGIHVGLILYLGNVTCVFGFHQL